MIHYELYRNNLSICGYNASMCIVVESRVDYFLCCQLFMNNY
jgi:hypothetical protein